MTTSTTTNAVASCCLLIAALLIAAAHSATISTITPNTGSLNGFTRVSILGTGFDIRGRSNLVYFGSGTAGVFCDPIPNECHTERIVCITPPYEGVGPMPVTVNSFGYNAICNVNNGCKFEYTLQRTPRVTLISPQWLIAPANITVFGNRFSQGDASVAAFDFTMWIGDEERCNLVSTITGSSFICNVIEMRPGLLPTRLLLGASGKATMEANVGTIAVIPSIRAISPKTGSLSGGQTVTIYGSSFSPEVSGNYVTIHGSPCIVNFFGTSYITCKTTPHDIATTSTSRQISPNASSRIDVFYDLPYGYDLDTTFIGTIQYLQPDQTVVRSSFSNFIGGEVSCAMCGFRVTGQFKPTVTGNHTFGMNADDYHEMWLSLSSEPVERKRGQSSTGSNRALDIDGFNARQIISRTSCCSWTYSKPQYLVAGQTYWLRMFVKNVYGALGMNGRVSFGNQTNVNLETMLFYSEDYESPVKVVVNDMQALPAEGCLNFSSCDFNFVSAATPVVSSVSPSSLAPLQTLTITGSGFDTTTSSPGSTGSECGVAQKCGGGGCACGTQAACELHSSLCAWSGSTCAYSSTPPQCFQWSLNFVSVGGEPCNVTSQTATTLTCTMPFVTAGYKRVAVAVAGLGLASGTSSYVNVQTVIDGFSPSSGSINGGNVLTIVGYGFDPIGTRVEVANKTCTTLSITFDTITCLVPPLGVEGSASVQVYTSNSRNYVLPTSYQYDAKPVRPGITTEVVTSTIEPISGPASGETRVYVTLPSAYSMSSSRNIMVIIGGVVCTVRVSGSNRIECITSVAPSAGTYNSYVSFTDKYNEGVSVMLPPFTYYHTIRSVTPQTIGAYGGVSFSFQLSGAFAPEEISLSLAGAPCTGFTMSGTVGRCTTGPRPSYGARPVIQSFDFLGDGNPLTNPLNFVQTSSGVTVDSSGNAFVPAGEFLMSKRSFVRPFALRVTLKATLPMVQFSNIDRSIILRAGVSQPTLATDGYRAVAGAANASFQLLGGSSSYGATTIDPAYAAASFDTTLFQEHRLELYNGYVRYFVNDVLIYTTSDSSYTSGTVGVGFSSQGVTVKNFVVESLAPELLRLNISGSPIKVPMDVFFTEDNLPSATSASVDSATGVITFAGAKNLDSSTQLLLVSGVDGRVNASSVALCPTLFTTMNPVSGALTYRCVPVLGLGTYWAVLVNPNTGAASTALEITIELIVSGITPSSIPAGGGRVVLSGAGFSTDVLVLLGSTAATIVSFNATKIIADIVAPSTTGSASLIVRDSTSTNVRSVALTITTLSPFNISKVSSDTAAMWSTITITGTGFSTGVSVYVGPNIASVQAVTSTFIRFQVRGVTADVFGNTTVKIVQPNVGIATFLLNMIPYVYGDGLTPRVVSSLGGAYVKIPGVSSYNLNFGTPTSTAVSNFGLHGLVSGWSVSPAGQNAPSRQNKCGVAYFGPFSGTTVLSRTFTGLPAHSYVRVVARLAIPSDWWTPAMAVNGRTTIVTSVMCDFSATNCGYPCVAEVAVIARHSGASLPVSLFDSNNQEFVVTSVTVETLDDIGYVVNISGVTAPVETTDRFGTYFIVPKDAPIGNDHVLSLTHAGVDWCHWSYCKLSVVAPSTITHATLVDIKTADGSPHFVPYGAANVSYTSEGTMIADSTTNIHFSTQRVYASDGPIIRVSATLTTAPVNGNTMWLNLAHQRMEMSIGLYTYANGRIYAGSAGRYLYQGPVVTAGDVVALEFDTRTSTASFLCNGIRFASVFQKVYWPMALTYTGPQALDKVTLTATAKPTEQRLVLYGTNLTQQLTNIDDANIMMFINGVPCRSTFITNGHISCYVVKGQYHAGDSLNVSFATAQGKGSPTVVTLRPFLKDIDATSGGSTGGLLVALNAGPITESSSTVSVCTDISVKKGDEPDSVYCTTRTFTESQVLVSLTTNGAASFVTNSTDLSVKFPAQIDGATKTFDVVAGPELTLVTLNGANLMVEGTNVPADATVILSLGKCTVITANATHIACDISGVAPGTHSVNIYSPTVGTAASDLVFTVTLGLVSATPSVLGVGGFVEMHIQGSGFGADGDQLGVSVTVDNVPICSSIYRMDSVLICTTKPGAIDGTINVTLQGADAMWTVESTFTVATDAGLTIPVVSSVSPTSGLGANTLTITGTLLAAVSSVVLGEKMPCSITSQSATSITCTIEDGFPAGHYIVRAIDTSVGASISESVAYNALLDITSVHPGQGPKVGGQLVTIYGTGFSAKHHMVLLSGRPCKVANVTSSHVTCFSSALVDEFTTDFDVVIKVMDETDTLTASSASYSYSGAQTAQVNSVSPSEVSAAGLELITVSGTGFGEDISKVSVMIGSAMCRVESLTDTSIQCRSTPTMPMDDAPVTVLIEGSGAAVSSATVSQKFSITSITGASQFSLEGGAIVTFAGVGFWTFAKGDWQAQYYNITMDGWLACEILTSTWNTVTCRLPPSPRPRTRSPLLSSSYTMRPEATMKVSLYGNSVMASVPPTLRVSYMQAVTPLITSVVVSTGTTTAYSGSIVTITGSGFLSSGNTITVNNASCSPIAQSTTTISCIMSSGAYGPGLVKVLVPGVGYAATTRDCSSGFLNCDGKCLTDEMCRYDTWGVVTCDELRGITVGETFCHANGGTDSTDQPFLTDAGVAFDLNCPMYSCEGNDCNASLSIGGTGAVVSSCGEDPNGYLVDFRATVTAISGGSASSIAGGLRLTILGNALPPMDKATVLFGGVNCAVLSATSSELVCETGATTAGGTSLSVSVYAGGYLAECAANICTGLFSYDATITPVITTATYVAAMSPNLTLTGSSLPTTTTGLAVHIGTTECTVVSTSATELVCKPSLTLSAGSHSIQLQVAGVGFAMGTTVFTLPLTILSFTPVNGSLSGGTIITLYGTGITNMSTLTVGSCDALVTSVDTTAGMVSATTSACSANANAPVRIRTGTFLVTASTRFAQTSTFTPTVSGTVSGNVFSLTLSNAGTTSASDIQLFVDRTIANCIISSFSLPTIGCEMESGYTAGSFNLTVYIAPRGYATHTVSGLFATYGLSVTSASATSGYRGGHQSLTIGGAGFGNDAAAVSVIIGDAACAVSSVTSTSIVCTTGSSTAGTFDIVVGVRAKNAVAFPNDVSFSSFTYVTTSPTVTSVYPFRGSTAGGTRLTIMGTDLSSSFSVSIAGIACTMSTAEVAATDASSGTTLYCTTSAYQPMYDPAPIRVTPTGGMGDAFHDGVVTYQYIDLWSRWTTWGNSPPPQFGDSAVVSEGDVVMVDYSPPRFHLIVVMGTMLFDDTTDILLECTYIMINYGRFIVGTPEKPFTHQATIRLWGDRLTPEIPVHGAKVLALRHGSLDMHGVKRVPTWTRVTATAPKGTSSIYVRGPVDWQVGEFIVVAPTDFDPMEGEVRMITGVIDRDTDNVTIVLEAPLDYTHWGRRQCFDGDTLCVDEIAEVGLLTRNVVVEGEPNSMNIGFAATMFLMPLGQSADRYCRLSFIEMRKAGQQYIVGRYPIHFHVTGTIANSYVNGTSVHHSLNRAFSIHGTSNNTYVDNVAYDIAGHAFFIEDGSERFNVINHNLVIQVLATTSNLNTDITPAAIWVTAPMNYIDNNAVSGSQTFGIWIMPFAPYSTGPTYSTSICPHRQALGSMDNNTAHSNLWHGFHVFKDWTPLVQECNANSAIAPAYIRNFVSYKNQIWGASMGNQEIGIIGAVILDNLTSADNGFENADGASFWIEHMKAPNMTCGLQNSLLIARTANNPFRRHATRRGVNLPQDDNFFVENVTFVNFDNENFGFEPQAWASFRSLCFPYGWEAMTKGLRWVNSPNRVLFRFRHHGIINDVDGTLTGTAGSQVVPVSPINAAPECVSYGAFAPMWPGLVCPNHYKIRRFGVSSSNTPQLDQIWRVEGREELNYAIDRSYVFTAPINREINITFQTTATPNWWWQFGGNTFMQDGEKALFVTKYLQFPYRTYVRFDSASTNTTYTGEPPTLNSTKSAYAFDNITGRLTALLVKPNVGLTASSFQCPTWGCDVEVVNQVWEKKCFHITDAAGWTGGSTPTSTTNAIVPTGVHLCMGYNASVASSAHRTMETQAVPRTCTASNQLTTYSFSTLTIYGAISMTNANCPCQGGRIVLNIAKYIHILGGGFILGNETHPITDCTIEINMRNVDWTANNLPTYRNGIFGYRAITLEAGLLGLHGAKPQPLYTRLASTANAGSRTLVLESAVQWKVGDAIAIAGTNRAAKYAKGSARTEQSEHNYITAISTDGMTLTLQNTLAYAHYGAAAQTLNGKAYRVGAEVTVLTRSITIAGDTALTATPQYNAGWKLNIGCTPKNREGCQQSQAMSAARWGLAQVEGVLMRDVGQGSMDDGAVNIDGLTDGANAVNSYFRYNAFWKAYNSPFFVRDTTTGLELFGNVAYDLWVDGINVASSGNNISSNLMMRMTNSDPLCEPIAYNIFWSCRNGMYRIHAGNTVQNNIAASSMTAGFVTEGDFCTTSSSTWSGNVAHSVRDGVLMADVPAEPTWGWGSYASPTSCRRLSGILTYWSSDHGIVAWSVLGNVTIQDYISVDDQIGTFIMTLQSGQFQNYIPEVNYFNVTYSNRWNNNDFACRAGQLAVVLPCRSTTQNSKFWCDFFTSTTLDKTVGNVGAMETIFASNALGIGLTHGEHKNMWEELDQYSTVGGHATYKDVHFANFDGLTTCGHRNLAFFQSHLSNDTFHQHTFERVTWSNVAEGGKVFMWRTYGKVAAMPTDSRTETYWLDFNNYIHGAYWPDSPNKQLINDVDGSFTQTGSRASIVASETLTRTTTFTQIGYDGRAFTGGKLAEARAGCTWQVSMNAYICDSTFKWLSLNLDSLADDQLTRRAGPIVICKGDGMVTSNGDPNCPGGAVDFASGPVMKGKAQRSTLDRLSRWRLWAEDGGNYTLAFRGAPPSWIRLQLQDYEYLGLGKNVGLTMNLRYFGSNSNSRVGVYVNGKRQASNIGYANPWDMVPVQAWPNSTAAAGTHFMNLYTDGNVLNTNGNIGFKKNVLYLTVRPGVIIDLIQEPVVQVNMQVSMTVEQFFAKKDTFVAALAQVLGIDASRIKVTKVVAGTTRRRAGSSVEVGFEIEQDPSAFSELNTDGSAPVGGSAASQSVELSGLVAKLDVLSSNTTVLAEAAGDSSLQISGLSAQQVSIINPRPEIAIASGTPYLAINATNPTNSSSLNATAVASLIANWVVSNFSSAGAPYDTTVEDGAVAVGNVWTNSTDNISQFTIIFSYENNTFGYAALTNLNDQIRRDSNAVLPGYTIVGFTFASNNYVPDVASPPSSPSSSSLTSGVENITKFAIGIGIGVAIVMVIGGAGLYHFLIVKPKLKLKELEEEKAQLREYIDANKKGSAPGAPQQNNLVGETMEMFPRADETATA